MIYAKLAALTSGKAITHDATLSAIVGVPLDALYSVWTDLMRRA